MPKVTWLGDVDNPGTTENDVYCTWGDYQFPAGTPVEVSDPHILHKARSNRFFRVEPNGIEPAAKPKRSHHKKKVVTDADH